MSAYSWKQENFPVIGLTGPLSSGKSFVAGIAKTLGMNLLNSDDIAKDILLRSSRIQKEAKLITSIEPILKNGSINKDFARTLFSDPMMLDQYESILHPLVLEEIQIIIGSFNKPYPKGLLIESAIWRRLDNTPHFDAMWVVKAPRDMRSERFIKKTHQNSEFFLKIESHQQKLNHKITAPIFEIINDGRELRERIEEVINETITLWLQHRI